MSGRARAARVRLPADVPAPPSPPQPVATPPGAAPDGWPEVPAGYKKSLWLCIDISSLARKEINHDHDAVPDALCRWAGRYTSLISRVGRQLFLEVGGSLRLFGGLQPLRERLQAELGARGYTAVLACAPTPRAAGWLAGAGRSAACVDRRALCRELAGVPLMATGWPARVQRLLRQMGLQTVGCCLKLPRDGFARRVGVEYLRMLDEALGHRPQLLSPFRLPLLFRQGIELDEVCTDRARLAGLADSLLAHLGVFLRRHQATVQCFSLQLGHQGGAATVLEVGAGRPVVRTGVLTELTALQLEQVRLPAPVQRVVLEARAEVATPGAPPGLPGIEPAAAAAEAASEQCAALLARLRARLGDTRVFGLAVVAEHRPEHAWRVTEPGSGDCNAGLPESCRPLWLLAQPRRIPVPFAARPEGGASVGRANPASVACPSGSGWAAVAAERIESGWWDGHDIRRDYYCMTGPDGGRWWVYRDVRDAAWYLHGLFA